MRTWRTIEVYHNKNLSGTSGTNTFSLPRTHMIGDLWLVLRGTNDAAGNISDSAEYTGLDEALDKISIKSGSKTFKSFDGHMARNLAAHRDGMLAPATKTQSDALVQEMVFPIHFGIEPQDEDVILPAPLLDSLDLVLEYSFSTAGSVGFQSGTLYFDLLANVLEPTADLEDKMILIQEKKQDVSYSSSNGDTPFDLTLDERRLLRKIYVDAYVTAQPEGYVCGDIEVKADNEQVIKADWQTIQFQNAIDHHLNYRDLIHTWAYDANGDVYRSRIPDLEADWLEDTQAASPTLITVAGDAVTWDSATSNADEGDLYMHSAVLPAMAVIDFDRDNSLRRLQPQGIRDLDIILGEEQTGVGCIIEESLQKIW